MSWKVIVLAQPIPEVGQEALSLLNEAGLKAIVPEKTGPLKGSELLEALDGADAVIADLDQYDASFLQSDRASRLKIISRWGVGYDAIDVKAATEAGIVVAYTPGMLNDAVADLAFGLLLNAARHVNQGAKAISENRWDKPWGHDVFGATLGIVGCGRIGQAVARRAAGFSMKVLGHDLYPADEAKALGIEFTSLDRLLAESDFITLHAAATDETRNMINADRLKQMKPDAYLINTARGALVDEAALAEALNSGEIAGAALDVFQTEPLPPDSPLRSAKNVVLTPHQASFSSGVGKTVSNATAGAIIDLSQGRKPKHVVNPEVFDSPRLRQRIS